MLKRIVVLSLLSVYFGTTVGFAMSVHFCGSKILNVRINQSSSKPCCSKEVAATPDKCCKDKHIQIKISDQQQTIQSAKIPAVSNLDLFIDLREICDINSNTVISITRLNDREPPELSGIPLTIKHCTFRS